MSDTQELRRLQDHFAIIDMINRYGTATDISSLFAQHRRPGQEETEYYDMHGDYIYTLVRTTNGWKIRGIKLDMRWQEGNPQLLGSGES